MATCLLDTQTDVEPSIAESVSAAQAGDREAFGRLFERFQPSVYRTALGKTFDPLEAQEVVQDVFIQAMRKLDQLRRPECFGGWLRSIAARSAINRSLRKRAVQAVENEILETNAEEEETPADAALRRERIRSVRVGMKRLKPLDRHTLTAFYVDGRSLAEMSVDFDSPIGTIKRRLHTARKRLAAELAEFAVA